MAQGGLKGLSLNAVPGSWLNAELRPRRDGVNFGFVGDIHCVSRRHVMRHFKAVNFIACACLTTTTDGVLCNINADTIATELAIGTQAQKLVFLSDVDGVLIDGKPASAITDEDIPALIENGTAAGGMRVKLENCLRALNAGVQRIHLLNGFKENALRQEIYSAAGPGTMILRAADKARYMNEKKVEKTT
jgi:acetylglutamate kinase